MSRLSRIEKAKEFQALHRAEGAFLMPNAWDAGSAILLEQAGFAAIGTTSAGIAFSNGLPDYTNRLSRDQNMAAIAQICEAVDLPVSADTENGYGHRLQDVRDTITMTINAGAAGASIEDYSGNRDIGLFDIEEAVDRVAAAIEAIEASGIPIVLTARAECFLCGHETPLSEAIKRLIPTAVNTDPFDGSKSIHSARRVVQRDLGGLASNATTPMGDCEPSNGSVLTAVGINRYREAGAHCLYAPGPKDAETIATLVKEVDGPLNVVAGLSSTALSVTELENLGVRRISTGGSLARVCLAALRTSAAEIMTSGTFSFAGQAIPDAELSALFAKDRE